MTLPSEARPPSRSAATEARWIKVWDAPTRLFHWCIVALVVTSYVTATNGWIEWHFYSGYAILTLVVFRILWGILGSETARFSAFVRGPAGAIRHLRHLVKRQPEAEAGHNAAGAYMVLALLALLLFQAVSGLFANDGLFVEGPLAALVGSALSDQITELHELSFKLIMAAVAVHVAAVLLYAVLVRQDLVRPMITGWKRLPGAITAPRLAPWPLAVVLLAVVAAGVIWIARQG